MVPPWPSWNLPFIFGSILLKIGAFLSMSGATTYLTLLPRMKALPRWVTRPSCKREKGEEEERVGVRTRGERGPVWDASLTLAVAVTFSSWQFQLSSEF